MEFKAGDKVSYRTLNKNVTGVLVRRIDDGIPVWILDTGHGKLVPVHENSMHKEEVEQ